MTVSSPSVAKRSKASYDRLTMIDYRYNDGLAVWVIISQLVGPFSHCLERRFPPALERKNTGQTVSWPLTLGWL